LVEKLHPRAIKGIILFNQKKFFDAHEELEIAWRDEPGQIRDLYRGILQVGVAYYHITRRNFSGAKKLIIRSEKWLEPFPDKVLGINIKKLKSDSKNILVKLENGYFDSLSFNDNDFFAEIEFKLIQDQK
jgi:predicted metal-dependent hydrolase